MGLTKHSPVIDLYGPCAKRQVRCTLLMDDGREFHGANLCRNPQPSCPRTGGEDYTKCQTICQQIGHAEAVAAALAANAGARGGIALLENHWYVCAGCLAALAAIDVHVALIQDGQQTSGWAY